mgnify:CR=1 FL=1
MPAAPAPALVDVGQPAPAFNLKDQAGKPHKLADFKGQWLVLYFYPKDDTSGCTKEACAFNASLPQLRKAGAAVVGVSPDDEKSHAKFATKYGLSFTLLADPDKDALQKYGVWQEKSMYGRKYMGVVRTTYLIDPKGKVAARWDKVSVTDHEQAVAAKLAELCAATK